jgi:hypothetical protein
MRIHYLLIHALLLAVLLMTIAPATEAQTIVDIGEGALPTAGVFKGLVYEDNNGNGKQDDPISEPGIPGVDVVITDRSTGNAQTVITDDEGCYGIDAPVQVRIKVDVDDSMLPTPGYLQTDGYDPSNHNAPGGTRDGYCWPATSPTQCCENDKKKVRIRRFLNRSGSSMRGVAMIDSVWASSFLTPNPLPSDGIRYLVSSSGWLSGKMETSIAVGFMGLLGSTPSWIETPPIAAADWHIKKCGRYRVRIWLDLDNTMDVRTKFDASCRDGMYSRSGATRWVCWEMQVDV